MSLTLITGRANAGKTGLLYRPLVDAANVGERAVLLLPTNADVVRARAELSERIAVGIQVVTLDGWAADLWSKIGDGRRLVTPAVRRATCTAVAADYADGPSSASLKTSGFARLLSDIAARSAGLVLDESERDSDREIVRLLRVYHDRIERLGLIEPGHALVTMAENPPSLGGVFSVNRFIDVSVQQERLVSGLASHADVRVALTWEEGFPATEALDGLVRRLMDAGAEHVHVPTPEADSELARIEERLFSPSRGLRVAGGVDLIEAAGPEAEISSVAAKVREFVDAGIQPDRIAVVFRRLGARWNNLEAALAAENVACSVELSLPFASTPFGRALLGLIKAASTPRGGREAILAYLTGPFSDLPANAAHELDASWRGRRASDNHEMLSAAARGDTYVAKAVAAARRIATGESDGIIWQVLADSIRAASLLKERTDAAIRLDAGAHRAFLEGVAALVEAGESLGIEIVSSACEGMTVSTGSEEGAGGVVVTDAHRIRARRFDAVILGGLSAAEFSSEHAEPLAATILARCGLRVGTDERLAERMLFYSVATKPRSHLTLVRQSSDPRGEPMRPSVFWDEVLSLYAPDGATESELQPMSVSMGLVERAVPTFSASRRALRRRVVSGELNPPLLRRGELQGVSLGVSADDEFTVTELETYVSCPYRWFYDRVVRPRTIDREFDARERGSAAHRMLSAVYGRMRDGGHARVTAENLPEINTLLHEEAEKLAASGEYPLLGLAEELDWMRAVRGCAAIIEQDVEFLTEFRPIEEEWSFGEAAGRPFSFAGVRFRGVADRIDCGAQGLIVTDYKWSSSIDGQSGFVDKGRFQPLIYARAASHHLGLPVVGGLYRSLTSRAVAGFWNAEEAEPDPAVRRTDTVDGERVEELIAAVEEIVNQAVAGMSNDDIAPRPRKDACKYCGGAAFCEASR